MSLKETTDDADSSDRSPKVVSACQREADWCHARWRDHADRMPPIAPHGSGVVKIATGMPRRSWDNVFPIALAVIVCVVFAGALSGEFLDWDDDLNFAANLDFRGLGWSELRWAWTTFLVGVYQPLAWMLLEIQYVIFGLSPFGYHLTSVLLHAFNAVLVYRLVARLLALAPVSAVAAEPRRRDQLAAAAAALLWAVHPLRTEVVAWASCQPYLPCATFALLAV